MCLSFPLTTMEYYDVLPNISLSRMSVMHKIWTGRRANKVKYEYINNSDLDGMSLASFCQSRAITKNSPEWEVSVISQHLFSAPCPLNPELFQKVVTHTLSYFHTACKKSGASPRKSYNDLMSEKQYFYFWQIILNSPDSMLQIDIQFANYFPSSPSKIMMETWNSASRVFFLYHWLFIWSPTLYG